MVWLLRSESGEPFLYFISKFSSLPPPLPSSSLSPSFCLVLWHTSRFLLWSFDWSITCYVSQAGPSLTDIFRPLPLPLPLPSPGIIDVCCHTQLVFYVWKCSFFHTTPSPHILSYPKHMFLFLSSLININVEAGRHFSSVLEAVTPVLLDCVAFDKSYCLQYGHPRLLGGILIWQLLLVL